MRARAAVDALEGSYRELFLQLTEALSAIAFRLEVDIKARLRLAYIGPAIEGLFGMSVERALERPEDLLAELVRDDGAQAGDLVRAAATRFERWVDELSVTHPDGTPRWVRVLATPMLVEGAVVYTGVFVDITGHKRVEEALRRAQKLEAVGVLAAGIAHNFNNILAGILPNLELCLESCSAEQRRPLEDARRSTLSAVELVRQLMLLARDGGVGPREPIALSQVLDRAISVCRKIFERRIELDVGEVDGTLGTLGFASQLEQVFLNLLINARDALAAINRPKISVQARRVPGARLGTGAREYALITVSDNGGGMDQRTLQRLGEPFFTTKDPGQGTGLGLATAYGITSDHGGRIECHSEVGKGTTFSVFLPYHEVAVTTLEPPRSVISSRRGRGRVLLIDDEPSVRRAYQRILAHAGFSVVTAEDGLTGLERFTEDPSAYELVLLDLNMPRVSGEHVLGRMRELEAKVPVIVVTGHIGSFSGMLDAHAVLQKPVTSERLIAEIDAIVARAAAPSTVPEANR